METKIKANFLVGSIACWSDYDKANGKEVFILKNHRDGSFHVVEINGTTITEICQFKVEGRSNQGICVYNGYLYVTEWGSDYGNSYLYFTANANYRDATKARKQHSLDGLYMVKKQLA